MISGNWIAAQILEEQRALLDAAPAAGSQPPPKGSTSGHAAGAAPQPPVESRGSGAPDSPRIIHDELAADWRSLRRSLDQLAILPRQDGGMRLQSGELAAVCGEDGDLAAVFGEDMGCRVGPIERSHKDRWAPVLQYPFL